MARSPKLTSTLGLPQNVALDNATIAELLALEAENVSHFLQRALRKASRAAFLWLEEATLLIEQERSLTELPSVGPYLEKMIRGWTDLPVDFADSSCLPI